MMIYLDYAATAPMRSSAIQAYAETATSIVGNTQSLHDAGSSASRVLEGCRELWGSLLNGRSEGMYFTGNASEGNQLAIRSLLRGRTADKNEIITTKLEHASVLSTLQEVEKEGVTIRYVPVDTNGVLELKAYEKMVTNKTALVAIQLVNSEMGAIQPIARCAAIAKKQNVPLHCDMVQAIGKIPVNLASLGVTSAVFSGHKMGGPKGVGMVWIDPRVHWQAVYKGTKHQQGFRAGTIDVPGIVAATIAGKEALEEQQKTTHYATELQQYLMDQLPDSIVLTGDPTQKSPFIQGMILPHVEGQWMLLECNRHQIAISTGTACNIGGEEAMSAMSAIGVEQDAARKFIRVSFSASTSKSDIDRLLHVIKTSMIS